MHNAPPLADKTHQKKKKQRSGQFNWHRKQNPSKKKKKKGPGSLTDTENKTHQKKKKKQRSGQFNWHRKQNPSKKKKRSVLARAVPGNCPDRRTNIQTARHVTLIYKIPLTRKGHQGLDLWWKSYYKYWIFTIQCKFDKIKDKILRKIGVCFLVLLEVHQ